MGKAPADVFLQDTRLLSFLSCQELGANFFAFFCRFVLCSILDLIFFSVIISVHEIIGWKLREIGRDLMQGRKGNSYLSKERETYG